MRADLLDRVPIVCPPCTWKKEAPAALRIERAECDGDEIVDGELRCVRCRERYPVMQGVAVLVPDGHRKVAQETERFESERHLLGPHLLAHFGDRLAPADREGLTPGDAWPRLAELPVEGLAVDLAAGPGRAAMGLSRRASFTLACDPWFTVARFTRGLLRDGRVDIRLVEEGLLDTTVTADITGLAGPEIEVVVADPAQPPIAPRRAGLVLATNLLERQTDPEGFLRRGAALTAAGGRFAVASPWTWWEEHRPPATWLGGGTERTRDAVARVLGEEGLTVEREEDLTLVLREHARLEQHVRPQLIVARRT